ncbi:MAG: response regulator [Bacteroidetes bacterium]|nr:response regulator [Bacteroidota bacterium]MBL6943951.1 response regulator [Bacteroidales bacterium]
MINSTLKNANILIVDDKQANIDVLTGLLEIKGYTDIYTTTDPRNTLSIVKKREPDLILLDLMMPHLNGYQVMEQLKAHLPADSYVPILVLTADLTNEAKQRALSGGAVDFLTKPFDLTEVDLRIKNLLETRYLHQQLANQNSILEEKVLERTAQLQEALGNLDKANKELQGLDRAKNSFLQLISHEIRTPLNGIVGVAHLLTDMLDHDNNLCELIDVLTTSVDRLEQFSTTALVITELQTNNYAIKKTPHKIDDIINDCIIQISDYANCRNINIQKELGDSLNMIEVDGYLMNRVILSLLHNAVKYSPDNSTVFIKTSSKGNRLICEIIDNGSGFTDEAIDNLFKPFSLGEDHMDTNKGLSLKAAKMIIDAHNGEIHINKLPQSGATVKLVLSNNGVK